MMRALVTSSIRFRGVVLGLAAAVMILGFVYLPSAPVDVMPEFSPPYVEVQTEALGLAAEEVEQLLTVPLEADLLNGVAWLDSIESRSVSGLSSIVLTFEPGTDPIRARQMVAERLTQAHALPNVSRPPVMLQPLSSANRVLMVAMSSDELSLIDMSVLARWTIRPRLMGVEGVANVAIWGQRERQLQVLVDPERLSANRLELNDIIETTGNALWFSPLTFLEASTPGTGGFIDTPNQRLGVQHVFPISTPEDLARVPIESDNDRQLTIGDVAEVVEDHQPLIGDAIVETGDGPAAGLLLVVEKFPEANTLAVTRAVEDALDAMRPGLSGIEFDATLFRPAGYIESAIGGLGVAAMVGLVLLAAVLALVLYDWRGALVSLLSIVAALTAAALVVAVAGLTINAMVVAGLVAALAVVVDDAVSGTLAVMRRRRADGDDSTGSATGTLAAVLEIRGPAIYATLALALVIVPLFLARGIVGALLPALLLAYAAAVAVSMLVALTVTPALAVVLFGSARATWPGEPRVVAAADRAYGTALSRVRGRERPLLAGVAVLAAGAVVAFALVVTPQLGTAATPALRERQLLIEWGGPAGTSHTEMSRIVAEASDELRSLDGVANVGAHVGRAVTSDRVVNINSGEIWLTIDPTANYDATVAAVQRVVDGYPGLARDVRTYPEERLSALATGTDDLVIRLFGQDLAVLREKADEVRDRLDSVDGVATATVERQVDEPVIQVEVDLEAAREHGLRPGDIRRDAATLLSGVEVGSLFEAQKVFEVVVWGTPDVRRSVTSVEELLIETASGELVPLGELADIRIAPAPTVIERDAVQRRIDVGLTVTGRDLDSVTRDVEAALAEISFPLETHAEILGLAAERSETTTGLLAVVAAAAVGIFLLLQAAFASWRMALAAFVSLPAALAGAMVVAVLVGFGAPLAAATGLLAVLGIAIRSWFLLADRYRVLRRETPSADATGVAESAAADRLVPTLTTTVATTAALLPFVILGGGAGFEIVQPMSLVILGGLVTTTLVSLFVAPLLLPLARAAADETEVLTVETERPLEPQPGGAG